MKQKIVGLLVATMFVLVTLPQIEAVENNEERNENKKVFGFCYIENIVPGEYNPAKKCPYAGGITIIGGGKGTETSVFTRKGGEEIGNFEGPQTVFICFMLGFHEYTPDSQIFGGWCFGVFVFEK